MAWCVALPTASAHRTTLAADGAANRHPLHTTITMVSYEPRARSVTATMRIFASDLAAAIDRRGPTGGAQRPPSEVTAFGYVSGAFAVLGRNGQRVALEPCGSRVTGDLIWVCLRGTIPEGLVGARVRDAALVELFDDQVNVVMIDHDGQRVSLLFTKGDGPKAIS